VTKGVKVRIKGDLTKKEGNFESRSSATLGKVRGGDPWEKLVAEKRSRIDASITLNTAGKRESVG